MQKEGKRESIELLKAGTNNLKDIDVSFPIGAINVVTGVSGSGKSSLVFDTLYSESYRRYVESLSSYARQYLKVLPKPKLQDAKNLPSSIAVSQKKALATNRSTVGTITELIDIFRILFSCIGETHCPKCDKKIRKSSSKTILDDLLNNLIDEQVLVLAPLIFHKKVKDKALMDELLSLGFSRLYVDGEIVRISECKKVDLKKTKIVIDRVKVKEDNKGRLFESIKLALKAGRGSLLVVSGDKMLHFSSELKCLDCDISISEPSIARLNFNHPAGACEECEGFGKIAVLDKNKIIPDYSQSLETKGVASWNFGKHVAWYKWAKDSAKVHGIDFKKPFSEYSNEEFDWLFYGDQDGGFIGVEGYFNWLETKKYKAHYRIHASKFRKYVECPSCHGKRLKSDSLAIKIDNESISDLSNRTIDALLIWIEKLRKKAQKENLEELEDIDTLGLGLIESLDEGEARLGYLKKVGVGYLTLERTTNTLSGGELQRINMARSLGSTLTGTLYCLDEPSSGLHARDCYNLMGAIEELKEQGNTVVLVEHEKALIKSADHLIEIGPLAGHKGGEVVYQGKPGELLKRTSPSWPKRSSPKDSFDQYIKLRGAVTHNLKGVNISIPKGHFTVVCGVSGSGKTSLIQHTLYPMLADLLGQKPDVGEPLSEEKNLITTKKVVQNHDQVIFMSQAGIGASTRSNIATYLGIFDEIRKIFANTLEAKAKKFKPGTFSFNVKGGRCEICKGLGKVSEDLSFLGEMLVMCPSCDGRRFMDDVLEVTYRGRNLLDILGMTVNEAREAFYDNKYLVNIFNHVIDSGLGYITLGQETSSFSGGEAQRLKLLNILRKTNNKKPSILIFDEPTTGLSDRDVYKLLLQLRSLSDKGHTVVVVEHHLGVIQSADWIIEIGPEAADSGGEVIFEGSFEAMKNSSKSRTAPFLN